MRRTSISLLVVLSLVAPAAPAAARAGWKKRIDRIAGGSSMSIAVRTSGHVVYRHKPAARRAPASNEKLLMSMALLDELGPQERIPTTVRASGIQAGVVRGDLWLVGRGDPSITGGGRWGKNLPFPATGLARLARKVKQAGVKRIRGSVRGATTYFAHDWWAQGWHSSFPAYEVALPSALTFEGNTHKGKHISDPERRAAHSLTRKLRKVGVRVKGKAATGVPPAGLHQIAKIASAPLVKMMRYMNKTSSNFFAEVLGKRVGVERSGTPGTIASGAAATRSWASARGVDVTTYDSSGLSYDNRASAAGIARLLQAAAARSWGGALRSTLARPGQGTLEKRLQGVKVRAKTGTLSYVSTLSGWVWLRRKDSWAEFSIMSNGLYKSTAAAKEDKIVRQLTRYGR